MMRHAPSKSMLIARGLVALICVALLPCSFVRAADAPAAAECLTLLSRAFPPSLPNHVVTRSRLPRANGVSVSYCDYRGDDRRSLVRNGNFSIREQDGKRVTLHSTNLVLHGGTWLAEAARIGPVTPGADQLSIDRYQTQNDTWRLPAQLGLRLQQGAPNDPIPYFGTAAIAFGYMVPADGRRLWDHGPDDRVTLHSSHDRIDDAGTIAVQIERASDVRTLWLDPALGMVPRQIVLEYPPGRSGASPAAARRHRLHSFRFDHVVSPPAIIGFSVENELPPQHVSSMEFTIERRPDRGGPSDQDFRDAIDVPEGTAVQVDGLGLNSHAWSDGQVIPTRGVRVHIP